MAAIIEIRDIVKTFSEIRAVDGVTLAIEQGTCFGLLGPNGAGKTTLIEVMEGISPPTAGTILYRGAPRDAGFREEMGIQLQNTELPQYLTVLETLETFRNLYRRQADLAELIDSCRLGEILARDNSKISGGQKQRLLLAMALANDPQLVFLDEPTTGLDPQARRYLWEIVHHMKAAGKTIVLTTHYMDEAQILCDRLAIMDRGKIIAIGTPQDLLDQHCRGATIILPGSVSDEALADLSCKWFRIEDRLEIQTDSINECIQILIGQGVDLTGMTVRSQTLEDLFLKLTGKEIRS